jgi:hypothetical protein
VTTPQTALDLPGGLSILPSFAAADPQHVASTVDVARFELGDFRRGSVSLALCIPPAFAADTAADLQPALDNAVMKLS